MDQAQRPLLGEVRVLRYTSLIMAAALVTALGALGWAALMAAGEVDGEEQWHPMPHPRDSWPSWSPCGKRIVFATDRGPKHVQTVYELTLDTGHIRPISPWLLGADQPGYSPEGTKVVFAVGPRAGVADLETGTSAILNRAHDRSDVPFYPTFRGEDIIVFMRRPRNYPHNCIYQLALGSDLTPRERSILIRDDYHLRRSASTHDGSLIAYTRIVDSQMRGGRTDICIWDSETGTSTMVFKSPHPVERLSWFPDNSRLLVSTWFSAPGFPAQYVLDTQERRLVRLSIPPQQMGTIVGEIDVSPDGEWLAYPRRSDAKPTSGDFAVTIWKCRLDGSQETELTHLPEWYQMRFPEQEPIEGYRKVFGDPDYDPNTRNRRE